MVSPPPDFVMAGLVPIIPLSMAHSVEWVECGECMFADSAKASSFYYAERDTKLHTLHMLPERMAQ
jgi:hypothetical protein